MKRTVLFHMITAGIARRKAFQAIMNGEVTKGGTVITNPQEPVTNAPILWKKKVIPFINFHYIVMNKPAGYVTSREGLGDAPPITNILPRALDKTIKPVGRLDITTTGVLLFTNDGAMAYRLTHPKFHLKKVYRVVTSRPLDEAMVAQIRKGVRLFESLVRPDTVLWHARTPLFLTITLHSGQYRVIKRLLGTFGILVKKLQRIAFGPITLGKLPLGACRSLTEKELTILKESIEKA